MAMGDLLESLVRTVHRPLIPFLKEPWTSKSKYPAILLETFLYGVYVVLFGYCTIILAKRKLVQRMLLGALIALFLLASADIAITLFFFFHYVLSTDSDSDTTQDQSRYPWSRTLMDKFALYIVANAIASSLLISRCYTVWQNKRIVIAPIVLATCGTVISFASIRATQLGDRLLAASFITSAAANLSVTFLIVVRMWWSSRKVQTSMRMDLSAINHFVASLIFDSGAIYSLSIFLYLLLHTLVLDACLTQIAGVTVTVIILRNSGSETLDDNTTFGTIATQPTQLDMRTSSSTTYASNRTSSDRPSAKK